MASKSKVPQGATVLQAAELAGKEIPRVSCYHERLSIAGKIARMCLVEVNAGTTEASGELCPCRLPKVRKSAPEQRNGQEGAAKG